MLDAFRCIPRILTIGGIVLSLVSGFSWHGADSSNVQAAELNEVRAAFYRGDYEDCMTLCQEEVDKGIWNDFWAKQLITTQLLTGRYEAALETYESVASKFSSSLPLRMLGAEAYRYCGQSDVARRLLEEIPELVQTARWRYNDRENLLAIGRYSLSIGEDARNVLSYYDAILKLDATYVDAHIAIAELAIEKADYQEAVNALKLALELRPDDPWIRYLLAKAWSPSDSSLAAEHLDAALELNPRQVESLLLVAENHITAEDYDAALVVLEEVLGINNSLPAAWALRAAIAHLRGNYAEEGSFRKQALEHWALNPEVDFLIGQTLSRHYRFVEGVQYQRRALKLDPQFVPAKFQLAQDLLRTGEEQQGWMLVDQVSTDDKYNVVAFNLKTLQARLEQFTTLEIGSFLLRMDAREAKIYGPRVAELLLEAEEVLTKKYQAPLKQPVAVEIFPQQSDFAIRTFGLPGGAGFLGVCFGPLITANSPASQGETPSNWESVLWHEFCHVVTLQKTNNRMPRWLSEGISVYEELERDSRWGQRMNPRYKQMLLGGDFTPLSELSGAFLSPKSPVHLQLAYYESSLAVRYLIDTHGLPLLQKWLVDLGMGVPAHDAFARRYGDADAIDADFEEYVRTLAEDFAETVEFDSEGISELRSEEELLAWIDANPNSYSARQMLISLRMSQEDWSGALSAAQETDALYPGDVEPGGIVELIAKCARELNDVELELHALEEIATATSDRLPVLLRLLALHRDAERWSSLASVAEQLLAVQPLVPAGHEALVLAAQRLGTPEIAVLSLRALQEMEPVDPAGLHFQLAESLWATADLPAARREALLALEYTPRYRQAQKLLVKIYSELQKEEQPVGTNGLPMEHPDAGRPPRPESLQTFGN